MACTATDSAVSICLNAFGPCHVLPASYCNAYSTFNAALKHERADLRQESGASHDGGAVNRAELMSLLNLPNQSGI